MIGVLIFLFLYIKPEIMLSATIIALAWISYKRHVNKIKKKKWRHNKNEE